MLLAVTPVTLVLLAAPGFILQLFDAQFAEGAWLLRILALGQLVNVATGSVGYLLMMTGHEKLMRNNIAVWAVVNLAGNLVLVPRYGTVGAAVSTAFCLAFMNIVSYVLVRQKLKIDTLGYVSAGIRL